MLMVKGIHDIRFAHTPRCEREHCFSFNVDGATKNEWVKKLFYIPHKAEDQLDCSSCLMLVE